MWKIIGVYNQDSFLIIHLQYAIEGRAQRAIWGTGKFLSSLYCNIFRAQINIIKRTAPGDFLLSVFDIIASKVQSNPWCRFFLRIFNCLENSRRKIKFVCVKKDVNPNTSGECGGRIMKHSPQKSRDTVTLSQLHRRIYVGRRRNYRSSFVWYVDSHLHLLRKMTFAYRKWHLLGR